MTCKLAQIFAHQHELMERFHRIEAENNLLETPDVPVDLNSWPGQARLRNQAWRVVEELGEALSAYNGLTEAYIEEVADTLHFLVEFYIVAGVKPSELASPFPTTPDLLEEVFASATRYVTPGRPVNLNVWLDFLKSFTGAVNLLKNRPWKKTFRPTEYLAFKWACRESFEMFAIACLETGISSTLLHGAYFTKAEQNHQRINSGA